MLSPASMLLARAFILHCRTQSLDDLLDAAMMPDLTTIAYHLAANFNTFMELLDAEELDEEDETLTDAIDEQIVILDELLLIAGSMDMADEIGRRKLFSVVRKS